MSTRDIRTPDEIVINVGRAGDDDESTDAKRKRRRGPLPPSKPNNGIFSRRQKPAGITFYDLGSVRSGAVYLTRPNSVSPPVTLGVLGTGILAPITIANYSALMSEIMADGTAGLAANNRKIKPSDGSSFVITAEIFGPGGSHIFTSNASPEWTDGGGLKITPAQSAEFPDGVLVRSGKIDASGTAVKWTLDLGFQSDGYLLKFTNVFDYAGPAVAPLATLKNGDNVFLVPQFNLHSGTAHGKHTTRDPIDGNAYGTIDLARHELIYRLIPRDFSNPDARFNGSIPGSGNVLDSYWIEAKGRTLALSPNRSFVFRTHHVRLALDSFEMFSGSFPFTDWGTLYNTDTGTIQAVTPNDSIGFTAATITGAAPGILAGIIQRGGKFYFIWRTN